MRLSLPKTQTLGGQARIGDAARVMSQRALQLNLVCFGSRAALQAEILVLRHQPNVLRRKSPNRVTFCNIDRLVFAELYRLAPGVLDALQLLKPETVIRWHRAGFRAYWRWKSRRRGGQPSTADGIRQLIREMSIVKPALTLAVEHHLQVQQPPLE